MPLIASDCHLTILSSPRTRSQAEDIFKSSVSDSLFTSPSMQRLKKQTDDMFASLSAYVPISIVTDTKSFFSSWFG